MNDILKLIIERGKDFGILCVTLIIITSLVLRYTKLKGHHADPSIISILRTVRIVSVISVIAIFAIKIYDTVDSSYEFNNQVVRVDSVRTEINFKKEIKISSKAKIYIDDSGMMSAIKRSKAFWTGKVTYDTLFSTPINDVRGFKIFELENVLMIYFNDIIPQKKFTCDGDFKMQEFLIYVNHLRKNGIPLDIKIKAFHISTIIGVILILAALYLSITMYSADSCSGCISQYFWGLICLATGLIILGSFRSCQ
jgi:hypothetical protein